MAYSTFAAIDIGSSCMEMVIYEISRDNGIKKIDHVKYNFELGRNTYEAKEVDFEDVEKMCDILYGFSEIMKDYCIDDYRAFATSALREAKNAYRVLDRIKVRTGLDVEILSNSEQRFIIYKALAAKDDKFNRIIEKSTALVDVGAGSAQVSIFDDGTLVTTQNVRLGAVRISNMMSILSQNIVNYVDIMKEYIDNDMVTLNELFLKRKKIHNVIFVGDCVPYYARMKEFFDDGEYTTRNKFKKFFEKIYHENIEKIAKLMDIQEDQAKLILPSAMVYMRMLDFTQAEDIWMPQVSLCDGMAVEHAQNTKKFELKHDFKADILAAAKTISKRYSIRSEHVSLVEKNALLIYDSIKKYHGLSERERFLLEIACILHDCGQYINMLNPEQCSYSIIMSTEIIGLSHKEREIIANVVKYNTMAFDADDALWSFDRKDYLTIAKLTAILRVSNSLDRGHRQKFQDIEVAVKDNMLVITAYTFEDITLEKAYFTERVEFFEEVYGLKPVIKQKR